MLKHAAIYLAIFVTMVVIDMIWLRVIAVQWYADAMGPLLADKPNLIAAVAFYLTSCLGLLCFVSWSLLTPDPFHIVRNSSFAWTEQLSDLFAHATAFAVLSAAWLGVFPLLRLELSLMALLSMLGYCLCIESLQAFVPGRDCCASDAIANIAGFLLGLLIVRILAWQTRSTVFRRAACVSLPVHCD